MQKAFSKLKLKSKGSNIPDAAPAVDSGKEPSIAQIYQSRLNYGVNFGSSFVLEKWIFHDLFAETGGDTELDAVSSLVAKNGVNDTRSKFENHWNNFVTSEDWSWLADNQVTSIRLPIGYWHVDGGSFTSGFKFEKFKQVYSNAWTIIKQKYVEVALQNKISVIIDIHGLPGGANNAGHSGESGSGDFWSDEKAQVSMAKMMGWIANDLKSYENIAGIQVDNEAGFANPAKKQETYYAACISEIRKNNKQVPVIISDGWWPDQWVKWVQDEQGDDGYIGVVIDDHVYRCFSDADKAKSPQQIIDDLNGDVLTNLTDNGSGADLMVGEWSCVLDTQSWEKAGGSNRDDEVKKYGQTQCKLFNERACGSYFWTFKFQSGNGGEWDFKTMTDKGAIQPFSRPTKKPSDDQFQQALGNAYNGHVDYWKKQDPNGKYQPELYKDGFSIGWKDADSFAKFNGSRIGRKEALKRARLQEEISSKGSSKYDWEWSQGYDEGVKQFYNASI
ncbi:EXG3 [Candida oxycetoniae]|uniref:EXG3 n=1 Tax=Candida oxycetoniae TaxID=497107 RepID=A0AAI9WY10_9ASCO|nr:EXG3 [Candida oxycetoniae]KAI3404560.2 EXG3 [Candida oxycetoniae]